jgi:Protein of unknown function (DUF2917)
MNPSVAETILPLTVGALVKLNGAEGTEVRCLSGRLWITQESELDDAILIAGGAFTLTNNGLAIIEALLPSHLIIHRPAAWGRHRLKALAGATRFGKFLAVSEKLP